MAQKITYEQIARYPGEWLPTDMVAEFMGTTAQTLRQCARMDPKAMGFPVAILGSSIKIPRRGFLYWVSNGYPAS